MSNQGGLWDRDILTLWREEAPRVSPVWACTLYQDSRGKKGVGPVYVRAETGQGALAWCQKNRSIIGWRGVRAHHYNYRPVHPTELGMVPLPRRDTP